MKSRDFCFWLQGFFELSVDKPTLAQGQIDCIQKHLALVFKHEIDPEGGDKKSQDALNKIHHGKKDDAKFIPFSDEPVMRC